MRHLYTLLWYIILPIILLRLLWRARYDTHYRQGIAQRFGTLTQAFAKKERYWIHAVSVGEVITATPLLQMLKDDLPHVSILLTTTTPTGAREAARRFGDSIEHAYLPFDVPFAIKRFLTRTQTVSALIVLETELWPNLFHSCHAQGIPVFIVNARLSPRSVCGYRRIAPLMHATLACVTGISARDHHDEANFIRIGAKPHQIRVAGNLKFDLPAPDKALAKAYALRQELACGRLTWICASTHPGEDEIILKAYCQLRQSLPHTLLILVPRHPQRCEKLRQLIHTYHFSCTLRSQAFAQSNKSDILLVDTIGELAWLYGCADVAFVGGSLVPHGGHNPLEPANLGVPVISGHEIFNFQDIYALLHDNDAIFLVKDQDELAQTVIELLQDPNQRQMMARTAKSLLDNHRGATQRTLHWLIQTMRLSQKEAT